MVPFLLRSAFLLFLGFCVPLRPAIAMVDAPPPPPCGGKGEPECQECDDALCIALIALEVPLRPSNRMRWGNFPLFSDQLDKCHVDADWGSGPRV